jgi:hypothetical protein
VDFLLVWLELAAEEDPVGREFAFVPFILVWLELAAEEDPDEGPFAFVPFLPVRLELAAEDGTTGRVEGGDANVFGPDLLGARRGTVVFLLGTEGLTG